MPIKPENKAEKISEGTFRIDEESMYEHLGLGLLMRAHKAGLIFAEIKPIWTPGGDLAERLRK